MNFDLPKPVQQALSRLEESGFSAYAVGGCVRDQVLGLVPHDYDICTSAVPKEMQAVFAGEKTIETGLRHGTLTVILSGMPLEITTFRLDGDYLDGRHPSSVQFTPKVEEDLARRDFTINAMAYSERRGLADPFGGKEDCHAGVIRCVGEPERRFSEDALRILRALRFSARLGFPIEPETEKALRALSPTLCKISRERIASELTGLLLGAHAGELLSFFPEVIGAALGEGFSPAFPLNVEKAIQWQKALLALASLPPDPALRWAAFLSGWLSLEAVPEKQGPWPLSSYPAFDAAAEKKARLGREILQSLKMPVKLMDAVAQLLLWEPVQLFSAPLGEGLFRLGREGFFALTSLKEAAEVAADPVHQREIARRFSLLRQQAEGYLAAGGCASLGQLSISGRDAAALGFKGPAIGQALETALLSVVRGIIPNTKDALLCFLSALQK